MIKVVIVKILPLFTTSTNHLNRVANSFTDYLNNFFEMRLGQRGPDRQCALRPGLRQLTNKFEHLSDFLERIQIIFSRSTANCWAQSVHLRYRSD